MRAKEKHRQRLLTYLADWSNEFPNHSELATILGVKRRTLYIHFCPAEINEILSAGLELRKRNATIPRAEIYAAMRETAKSGNVQAQKEFLDRTEGKVTDSLRISYDESDVELILNTLPQEQAELTRVALLQIAEKTTS